MLAVLKSTHGQKRAAASARSVLLQNAVRGVHGVCDSVCV